MNTRLMKRRSEKEQNLIDIETNLNALRERYGDEADIVDLLQRLEDTNQNLASLVGDRERHWNTIALPLSIGVFGGIMGNLFVNSIETYGSWVEIVTVLVFTVFFIYIYVGPSGWAYKEARKQKKELQRRLSMLTMNEPEQEEEGMEKT